MKPVLFVTNHAPAFRVGAFAALHAREDVVFALIGGDVRHGGGAGDDAALPFPVLRPAQHEVARLAASGRYRAVIAGLSGRVALPAAYAGARRAGIPFVLWATIWAHPRTVAHAASYRPLRHLYRSADAVVTYGPHVSRYVRARAAPARLRGAAERRRRVLDGPRRTAAPRPVPGAVRGPPRAREGRRGAPARMGRRRPGARRGRARARRRRAARAPGRARDGASRGPAPATEVRDFYAGSDVVVVPSIPTRAFREPWGLVVNEAFDRGVPVIASTAVGAAAGGLVRHGETGLVVPAGNPSALAAALRRMHGDPALRRRLGAAARDARARTPRGPRG